jgi:hypothetical protein
MKKISEIGTHPVSEREREDTKHQYMEWSTGYHHRSPIHLKDSKK